MYHSIQEFLMEWKLNKDATSKVMAALTDESLAQKVSDDDRTLGRIAWHIATAIPEMMEHIGLVINSVKKDAPVPKTANEISLAYMAAASELADIIAKNWTDENLHIVDDVYGEKWPRGMTLGVLLSHEIHHRGQMTVLMRQAGLKVPGIMGPSREEWVNYGMNPPAI